MELSQIVAYVDTSQMGHIMIDWYSEPLKVSPVARIRFAWTLLILSVVLWPVLALTVLRDEPQGVLGLSFLAITFTAVDILITTDVRVTQDDN